ncbi:MAG TPA: c-type cytochrome, partial [Pirellulaceae bacterium]|nr:c-type cytochrome [Pirellulaceae bacterium]
ALVLALNEPSIPNDLRIAIGATLTRSVSEGVPEETARLWIENFREVMKNLREVMKRAPSRLQSTMAETLAGDADGANALLVLVETGHASPRLLLAPNVSAKFASLKDESLDKRAAAITAKLPPFSETLDKLILERRVTFAKAAPNLEKGQAVFTKHCAGCHQIEGKGSVVGPQLDGIGGRGLERIIEDILDPNRNVDVAFRTTTIRKTDGQIVSGLVRREEGAQLVLADKEGKEFTLAKDDIDEQQKTSLSLMPANVPEIVPAEEFHDLIGWLLSKRAAASK